MPGHYSVQAQGQAPTVQVACHLRQAAQGLRPQRRTRHRRPVSGAKPSLELSAHRRDERGSTGKEDTVHLVSTNVRISEHLIHRSINASKIRSDPVLEFCPADNALDRELLVLKTQRRGFGADSSAFALETA